MLVEPHLRLTFLFLVANDDGDGADSLVSEWHQEISWGLIWVIEKVMLEKGWFQWLGLLYFLLVVGEEWVEPVAGVELIVVFLFFVFFFPLGCGWESDCEWDWISFCCLDGFGDGFFLWYFPPSSSVNKSPLSLVPFQSNDMSMDSDCVPHPHFFFALLLMMFFSFVVAEVTVVAVEILFGCFSCVGVDICVFKVDFFLPPQVTWVHPSSSLLGWSPVSGLGLLLVGGMIIVVAAAVVVVVVGRDDVGLVVFWGQDQEKSPSCLQFQHWGLLLSMSTVMIWSSYLYGLKPLLYPNTWSQSSHRVPSHLQTSMLCLLPTHLGR